MIFVLVLVHHEYISGVPIFTRGCLHMHTYGQYAGVPIFTSACIYHTYGQYAGCLFSQGGAHIYHKYGHPGAHIYVKIGTRVCIFL